MRAPHSIRLAIAATVTLAVPVCAQETGTPRGFLFGAGGSDVNSRNSLSIFLDMSGSAVSDPGVAAQSTIGDADFLTRGFTSQWLASADYARSRSRTQFVANGATSFRYFSNQDRLSPVSHTGNVSWAVRLPRRSILRLSSGVAYAPTYLYELFPTGATPDATDTISANPDYQIHQTKSYSYATKATLRIGAVKSPHVTGTVEHGQTEFEPGFFIQPNLSTSSARVQMTDPISSNAAWSVEYEHSAATYGVTGVTSVDRFSGAVEYSHALSRTRHARFLVNIAPAILHAPSSAIFDSLPSLAPPGGETDPNQDIRLYQLESDAAVEVNFSRRLQVGLNYRRGIEYLPLLTEPVFADAVRVELTGLITRRVDWSASAGHARGTSALIPTDNGLTTSATELRMRYAFSRALAAYAEYLRYSYDLNDEFRLARGLPRVFSRNEIRFGGMLVMRPIHSSTRGRER